MNLLKIVLGVMIALILVVPFEAAACELPSPEEEVGDAVAELHRRGCIDLTVFPPRVHPDNCPP